MALVSPRPCRPALLVLLLLSAGCAAETAPPPGGIVFVVAPTTKYVDSIDVAAQVRPIVRADGSPDPAFYDDIGHPSPFYRDFYGVQALADTTREGILRDFVPAHASFVAQDAHSLTLRFAGGYTLRFFPGSALELRGLRTTVPFDHAFVSGESWRDQQANLLGFRRLLESSGLGARYLVANPLHAAQQETARLIVAGVRASVMVDPDLTAFDRDANAVLLVPEEVHGDDRDVRRLVTALENHSFDWLGMEALPAAMQPTLEAFNRAPEGSATYSRARAALLDYFTRSIWNGRPGQTTAGEDNYYFRLIELARRRRVRVVGLEGATNAFMTFEYSESPFGVAARNYLWAQAVPSGGRGAILGGSGHMRSQRILNVQDFLATRDPGRPIVSLAPIFARRAE